MVDGDRKEDESAHASGLSAGETVALIAQTLFEAIPFGIGSALNTAVFGTLAAKQAKRMEVQLKELAGELTKYAGKIDKEYFETDEFLGIFRRSLEILTQEHHALKQRAVRNLLLRNTIEGDAASYDLDAYILGLLGDLSAAHLACLLYLSEASRDPQHQAAHRMGWHTSTSVGQRLRIQEPLAYGLLSHLKGLGLVMGQMGMAISGGAHVSADVSFALTETGLQVLQRYVDLESEPKQPAGAAERVDS